MPTCEKKLNKKAKENNLKQELEWPDKTYFFCCCFVVVLFIRHYVDKENERGRKKNAIYRIDTKKYGVGISRHLVR